MFCCVDFDLKGFIFDRQEVDFVFLGWLMIFFMQAWVDFFRQNCSSFIMMWRPKATKAVRMIMEMT